MVVTGTLNEERTKGPISATLMIRKNGTVVAASEWYYAFTKSNSAMSLFDLVSEEDANALKKAVEAYDFKALPDEEIRRREAIQTWDQVSANNKDNAYAFEMFTILDNRLGDVSNVLYLSLGGSNKTENGIPLLQVELIDVKEQASYMNLQNRILAKYRYFMTLSNAIYFEYRQADSNFVAYKYVNGKSVKLVDEPFDLFIQQNLEKYTDVIPNIDKYLEEVSGLIKEGVNSFDKTFMVPNPNDRRHQGCRIRGGRSIELYGLIVGLFQAEIPSNQEAYYLTPAGHDAGTGLLNKRAATEYAIEKLATAKNKAWMLVMDVDDFKHINDSFGHLFGDEVIKYIAETLSRAFGLYGVVGRFGGDEYFGLIDKDLSRDELKNLLKTIVKDLAIAFDPKITVTMSIGVSQYPTDGSTFEELFAKADQALYIAKEKGKNRHIIYDEKLHGSFNSDSMHKQSLAYAITHEKRREVLTDSFNKLITNGIEILEQPAFLNGIRAIFDIDGISIYSEFGEKMVATSGSYIKTYDSLKDMFESEEIMGRFDADGVRVENNIAGLKEKFPEVYKFANRVEVESLIECVAYKNNKPYALISFDIFNAKRKWSNVDIESISVIGTAIVQLIAKAENN